MQSTNPSAFATPCVAAGQLTNAATGKGTPGSLFAWHRDTMVELFRGRTDGDGRFRFDRLPAGDYWCVVEPDEARSPPEWLERTLAPGDTWTIDVALDPGVELSGTVTDAITGKPIAGARIGEGWTLVKGVTSAADGRYVMRGYGEAGQPQKIDLCCTAPGYERVSLRDVVGGDGPRRRVHRRPPGGAHRQPVARARGAPSVGGEAAVLRSAAGARRLRGSSRQGSREERASRILAPAAGDARSLVHADMVRRAGEKRLPFFPICPNRIRIFFCEGRVL